MKNQTAKMALSDLAMLEKRHVQAVDRDKQSLLNSVVDWLVAHRDMSDGQARSFVALHSHQLLEGLAASNDLNTVIASLGM